MAKKITKRGPVAPEMNITPLIDVVFLLIIFFLIVSKIVSDERTPMLVPQLVDPQSQELDAPTRVIVNVARSEADLDARRDQMGAPGQYAHLRGPGQAEFVRLGAGPKWQVNDANLTKVTQHLKAKKQNNDKVEVLLRADSALHFQAVAPVMDSIVDAGIATVNVVSYTEEQPF
jgi:biopolymer transport protein ExbD